MSRRRPKKARGSSAQRRRLYLGLALVAALVIAAVVVVNKSALVVALTPGENVSAVFARNYQLQVGGTAVKLAGTQVGTVSDVSTGSGSTIVVSMKLDSGTRAKLGSDPSAAIRPVTALGGRYYVQLSPGGVPGDYSGAQIAVARTTTPVELSQVLQAFQPSARAGLQNTIDDLNNTLSQGGSSALQSVVDDAPNTLGPAGSVLNSALGSNPGTDLPQLVTNLDRVSAVLTRNSGQLASILANLQSTAGSLAAESQPLSATVADLPQTLSSARTGLADLGVTLDKLDATAPGLLPTAVALNTALQQLDPALATARPVVNNLRSVLADAQPLTAQLVPTSQLATSVLNDVRGPVLDRVNGPIISRLDSKWSGVGDFAGGGNNGRTTYQELGVLAARFDNLSKYYDQNGPFANLQAGAGTNSVGGVPGLDRLLLDLTKIGGAPK